MGPEYDHVADGPEHEIRLFTGGVLRAPARLHSWGAPPLNAVTTERGALGDNDLVHHCGGQS